MTTSDLLLIKNLQNELSKRDTLITHLQEQLDWFKRQLFGKRSERIVADLNEEQLFLPGFEIEKAQEEETQTIPAHTRKSSKGKGGEKIILPADLPIKTTVIDLPDSEKVDKQSGQSLVCIGEEITHKLAHKPGSYYIKEIIRPKYAHPEQEELGVMTADLPDFLFPKCKADESLLAEIVTQKFADHLPLYRIAEIMHRRGIRISRKLLSQWVIRCGQALRPLYVQMRNQVLESKNIFVDETPVKLQAKEKCKEAYMWVVVGGEGSDPPYRIYSFRENRRYNNAFDLLEGYRGALHSDKYGAYQQLAEKKVIDWQPCFSHIRRKFFEAETKDSLRNWVLRKIRYLFMLERVAWSRSEKERLRIRQEKQAPIIDELTEKIQERLVSGSLLPKSKFRQALGYYCGLIPYLKNYHHNPFGHLDNNVAERAIRPLAIGRKNWLFFGSRDGGEAGSILLSFVQTCRGLGINPREYLEDIFRRLMSHPANQLRELLPDQWQVNRKSPK